MTFIVGLTGGIGSGKTVASDHFATLGVPIIDTDVIARHIVAPGQATLIELVSAFGTEILNRGGQLDRKALRTIAFSNPENKTTLDSITHPAIRVETLKQINDAKYPYCIVVIPLLTPGSAFTQIVQRILVVVAERKIKIDRVNTRSGLSDDEVESIMDAQISDCDRLTFADDVINNNSSIDQVKFSVDKLHKTYLGMSSE